MAGGTLMSERNAMTLSQMREKRGVAEVYSKNSLKQPIVSNPIVSVFTRVKMANIMTLA